MSRYCPADVGGERDGENPVTCDRRCAFRATAPRRRECCRARNKQKETARD